MKYVCVTHVDSKTGVPGHRAPMRNGPKLPDVKGFEHEWHDESQWPLTHPDQYPKFYGTCDDDANLDIQGVMFVFQDYTQTNDEGETKIITAQEQYQEAWNQELKNRLPSVTSPMRIRLALFEMGLLEQIQDYVDALEEPNRTKVLIMWEYSTEIVKHHPVIQQLAKDIGIDEETLDNIFIRADSISEVLENENKE